MNVIVSPFVQAIWLTSSSECVSSALCMLRNIYSPNVKVSRLLLLAGASPNHITEYLGDAPALCMYAHEGSVEMVSLLLEFGADVELTNSQGCTALSLAAARGHCDVVRRYTIIYSVQFSPLRTREVADITSASRIFVRQTGRRWSVIGTRGHGRPMSSGARGEAWEIIRGRVPPRLRLGRACRRE